MRNIKYIGTKPTEDAFFDRTQIIWTPGKIDTVLDDAVATEMLRFAEFEDAGDSRAFVGAMSLDPTTNAVKVGGADPTSAQRAGMRAGMGVDVVSAAPNDGIADATAVLQAEITANARVGLLPGTYKLSATLVMTGGKRLIGSGADTVLDISYGGRAITVAGNDNSIESLAIASSADLAITSQGIINCDNTVVPTGNLLIDGVVFDTPLHGMNHIMVKGQSPSGLVSNVRIRNCVHKRAGRMAIEVLGTVDGIDISGNYINSAGMKDTAGYGMGVSLSGTIKNSRVSNNTIGNCGYACIEVVGAVDGCLISGNSLFGTNGALITNTNGTLANGLVISGNSSEPGVYAIIKIHAASSPLIVGNTFYVTRLDVASIGTQVLNNRIFSNAGSAVQIDNVAKCRILNNYVDNTAAAANNAVIRCYRSGATLNEIRDNFLARASGGAFVDENTSAANNYITNNRDATTLRQTGLVKQFSVSTTQSSNQYAKVLFGATALSAGSWRGIQFRVVVSGCESGGGNPVAGSLILFVRAKDNATTPVLISEFVEHVTGMTFTCTMIVGGFHIRAVPSAGAGQVLTWSVENLSTGITTADAPETLTTIVAAP